MTRRSDKQAERTHFYVPDGSVGEVWVIDADPDGRWGTTIWANKQIANQYADWLNKTYNDRGYKPYVHRWFIATKMREVS